MFCLEAERDPAPQKKKTKANDFRSENSIGLMGESVQLFGGWPHTPTSLESYCLPTGGPQVSFVETSDSRLNSEVQNLRHNSHHSDDIVVDMQGEQKETAYTGRRPKRLKDKPVTCQTKE